MKTTPCAARFATIITLFFAGSVAALADTHLTQTATLTTPIGFDGDAGKKEKPLTQKTVSYYKGSKSRVETPQGVTIYDAATDKTLVLNDQNKTYYEITASDTVATSSANPIFSLAEIIGEASVVDTQEQKNIAGKSARHFTYNITVRFKPKDANAPAALLAYLPTIAITGDQWTTESPDAPAATKNRTASLLAKLPIGAGNGLKSVVEKMATITGIPLEQTQRFKITLASPATAPGDAAKPTGASEQVTVTQVKTASLSEAPLPDSLFTVPGGYKKVTPPKTDGAF